MSYATADRNRVELLVAALEQSGWSVFWDHRSIPIGKDWRDVIEEEVCQCRCILVVWSQESIKSKWVKEEASEGSSRKVLLPIRIDNVLPPFGFRETQTGNFVGWNGNADHPEFIRLVGQICSLLGQDKKLVTLDELLVKVGKLREGSFYLKSRSFTETYAAVHNLLQQYPLEWQEKPSVQCALGELYAEYAPEQEAFRLAREAFGRAISSSDFSDQVPVSVLEQRALLEARQAEVTIDDGDANELIISAINRLTGLLEVTEDIQVKMVGGLKRVLSLGNSVTPNIIRWSLLGSVWKRKAVLLQRDKVAWGLIVDALQNSRVAYTCANGNNTIDNPDCSLYVLINRLQLDGLLATGKNKQEISAALRQATRCKELAHQQFAHSYDFFDAIMPADAQVAVYLLDGSLAGRKADELVKLYRDAVESVPSRYCQFDSVVRQLRIFAGLLEIRQHKGDAECVQVLLSASEQLMQS